MADVNGPAWLRAEEDVDEIERLRADFATAGFIEGTPLK